MAHHWIESDDIKILYIAKFGYENIPYTKSMLTKIIGITMGSFSYRLGNFKAIEGVGAATHYAKLSKKVYDKYNHMDEKKLKELAFFLN